MRKAVNSRLLSQQFPRIMVGRGEINAKFIFDSPTDSSSDEKPDNSSEPATNSPKSSAEDAPPKTSNTTGQVNRSKELQSSNIRSDLQGMLHMPPVSKMMGSGAVPRAVVRPVSTTTIDPSGNGGNLISEIKLSFRTVTE